MKITVYTTTDCQFSKAEKDYLASHKLAFEEKNLEANKDFLTEMLAISNNFAGTPVTRVEKDDGTIAVLKGFTKEEFDTTLGFAPAAPAPSAAQTPADAKPSEPAATELKKEEKPPTPQATPPQAPMPEITQTPPPPKTDEKLGSVLDKLEEKSTPETTPPPPPVSDSGAAAAPTIPDFPAK